VIVGAGFGGLWAARALDGEDVEVLLVDRNNFHTFYPLLYQIGAAELDATEICYPVRKILRDQENARFMMAAVDEVRPEEGVVRAGGETIRYDHLILATGSDPHFFGVEGAAEHAFPLRVLQDGIALRNHVLSRFERAARMSDSSRRRRALTFVIVGGGPTGVEYAGALAELVYGPIARDYPEVDAGEVSILLVEALDHLLTSMPRDLGDYAAGRLETMGVDVRTGTMVEEVSPGGVRFAEDGGIESETVVWTAGVQGDVDAGNWGLPVGRGGRVEVESTLAVPGHPAIQVVGDLAGLEQDGEPLPQIAPVAIQQGEHAARNVLRALRGEAAEPFRYEDRGMLATVGRNHAVARIFGRSFRGFPAWLLWLAVHIAKLIGFRNRLVVLTNWAWDYFTYERFVRLILPLADAARLETTHGEPALPAEESVRGLEDGPGDG
jgi:NADH dehydrogenase